MIFLQLLYSFLLIGAFTFGGGYSMIALIQAEVVGHWGWMTASEFADLLAVSQMTPGPVGINTATYAGYTAVLNAGYPLWAAVLGSLLASFAVIAIPLSLTLTVGGWLMRNKERPHIAAILRTLRLAVIGLIAAAALSLMTEDCFGVPSLSPHFIISILIFAVVFILSLRRRISPLWLIVGAGLTGVVAYSIL